MLQTPGRRNGNRRSARGVASLLVSALVVAWAGAAQLPADDVAIPNATGVFVDRVAPVAGQVAGPAAVNGMPIVFTYSGASDDGGSGLKAVTLWMRKGATGAWTQTSVSGSTAQGSLSFQGLNVDGAYSFALQAEDNAGNLSPRPEGNGDVSVVLDRKPPTITLNGASSIWVNEGDTYTDAGAKANDEVDGDLTSDIVTENPVDTSKSGTYFVNYSVLDHAGNAASPVYRTVKVEGGYTLTLTPPVHGSLEANPAPGINGRYVSGTSVTIRYIVDPLVGYNVATWEGALADMAGSDLARVVMDGDKTVSVALARHTGSIVVNVTPDEAGWTVTDGDGHAHPGSRDAILANIPAGSVSIEYAAVTDMTPPAAQQAYLMKDGRVNFRGVYAASQEATVVLPKGLEGAPGDIVECSVAVSTSQSLSDFRIQLKVDPAVARVANALNGALTSGWGAVTVEQTSDGAVLSASGAPTATGGGVLAVVRLQVVENATDGAVAALQASSVSLNGGALVARSEDGELVVHAPRFAWGDANGDGSAGDMDASLLLQYRVGLVERLADDACAEAADVHPEDPKALGTMDAALILQRGVGGVMPFPADTDGDGFGPESNPASPVAPSVETPREVRFASTVDAERGVEFGVPIALDNASNVLGYFAQVAYDPSTLEFLSVGRGSLTESWTVPMVNTADGQVAVAAAGAEAASGAGSLVVLNFRTRLGSGTGKVSVQLQLTSIELNDGAIPCATGEMGAAPVIELIAPARGAQAGGSVVTIKGANLGTVTEVRFGGQAAPWVEVYVNRGLLKAVAPAGAGTVDVAVVAPEGTATLPDAFTYFVPDVYLTLQPQSSVQAGQTVDVPVTLNLTGEATVTAVEFEVRFDATLFAVRPGGAVTVATPGSAAVGKQLIAKQKEPGCLSVSISGTPSQPLSAGLLCTCHLLALGDTSDTTGLFYISDISATNSESKSVTSDSGTAKAR